MAGSKFGKAISGRIFAGVNRASIQISVEIVTELVNRSVATFGFFTKRDRDDRIKIAAQVAAQGIYRCSAEVGYFARIDRDRGSFALFDLFPDPDNRAGARRFALADNTREF